MKLKRMECSNCGGQVRKEADGKYLCQSCGTPFVMDMDPEDVEYERLKLEQERLKNAPPQTGRYYRNSPYLDPAIKERNKKRARVIIIVMLIIYVGIPTVFMMFGVLVNLITGRPFTSSSKKKTSTKTTRYTTSRSSKATPTPAPVYVSDTEAIIKDRVYTTYILEAADEKIESFKTEKVPTSGGFAATDSGLVTAYLVNSDDYSKTHFHNRIYLVYRISWENEEKEKIDEFFPVYLDDITVKDSGVLHSDYIIRDDFRFTMKSPRIFYGYETQEKFVREVLMADGYSTYTEFDPNAD